MEVKTALPGSPPPLALLERPLTVAPVRLQLGSSAKPSPHETKTASTCPVLAFSPAGSTAPPTTISETARRRMRRQKKRLHEKASNTRLKAAFYRPSTKHGPVGYAMGYEGSWAVDDEEERSTIRYMRDSMKTAQWASSAS